ncbi:MAG TPA: ATP-binding protein [Calditrichae bacterium]|nr:ATP-binding protein [Calditrichia bacterium]
MPPLFAFGKFIDFSTLFAYYSQTWWNLRVDRMKGKVRNVQSFSKTLVIGSDLANLSKVEQFIEEISRKAKLDEDQEGNLAIGLTELVNNAILHGNQSDPSKKVTIEVTLHENRLTVSVQDEGSGFDPEALEDPLSPENLLKESGRGIFLVEQLVGPVTFSRRNHGTEARFILELD